MRILRDTCTRMDLTISKEATMAWLVGRSYPILLADKSSVGLLRGTEGARGLHESKSPHPQNYFPLLSKGDMQESRPGNHVDVDNRGELPDLNEPGEEADPIARDHEHGTHYPVAH